MFVFSCQCCTLFVSIKHEIFDVPKQNKNKVLTPTLYFSPVLVIAKNKYHQPLYFSLLLFGMLVVWGDKGGLLDIWSSFGGMLLKSFTWAKNRKFMLKASGLRWRNSKKHQEQQKGMIFLLMLSTTTKLDIWLSIWKKIVSLLPKTNSSVWLKPLTVVRNFGIVVSACTTKNKGWNCNYFLLIGIRDLLSEVKLMFKLTQFSYLLFLWLVSLTWFLLMWHKKHKSVLFPNSLFKPQQNIG